MTRPISRRLRGLLVETALDPSKQSRKQRKTARARPISLLVKKYKNEIVTYTMGYTRDELLDYVRELRLERFSTRENVRRALLKIGIAKVEIERQVDETILQELKTALWRIRQERVPMALSGNPGCNWRTFRDEATRFKRGAAEVTMDEPLSSKSQGSQDDPTYWEDPKLPEL